MNEAGEEYALVGVELKYINELKNKISELEAEKSELIRTLINWNKSLERAIRECYFPQETFNLFKKRYTETIELLKTYGVDMSSNIKIGG